MTELIIFILLTYGLSYIISQSEIFSPIRENIPLKFLSKLVNCMTCTSFWVAMGVSFIIPITSIIVFDAIIGVAAVNLIEKITGW